MGLVDSEFSGREGLPDELVDDQVEPRPGGRPEEGGEAVDDGGAGRAGGLLEEVFFGRDLGLGVDRLGEEGRVLGDRLPVGGDPVVAVGRGEDEPAGAGRLGELEDVPRPVEVAGEGGLGPGLGAGRIADDGRQVDDGPDALEGGGDGRPVADVGLEEGKIRVVEIGEERAPAEEKAVDDDDPAAEAEEQIGRASCRERV